MRMSGNGRKRDRERSAKNTHKAQEQVARDLVSVSVAASDPFHYYAQYRHSERRFVLHVGPTNSGKTHDALQALMETGGGVYLAPLRLLALETGERLRALGFPCDIVTGEERSLEPGARITSRTVEMLDMERSYACAVIDECQMAANAVRGGAWTRAIMGINASVVHVCMAPEALDLIKDLISLCGDAYRIVRHERATPLIVEPQPFDGTPRPGDALIAFNRQDVITQAVRIESLGIPTAIVYGALPWPARRAEAERFASGEAEVLIATDAIGMGLNLPIRRIVFTDVCKYDGRRRRTLEAAEVRQIAGRAGRLGMFDRGLVTSSCDENDWIRRMITVPMPSLSHARLPFPRELGLDANASLTDILKAWRKAPLRFDMLRRTDITGPIAIAMMLEAQGAGRGTNYPADRETLIRLAFLPVDHLRDRDEVSGLYQGLKRRRHPMLPGGDDWSREYGGTPKRLVRLEQLIRTLGIRFAFARKMGLMDEHMEAAFAEVRTRLELEVIARITGPKANLIDRRITAWDEWIEDDEEGSAKHEPGVWRF